MQFNGHGYLDPGIHPATESDIEAHLVDAFPSSTSRTVVFAGYTRHAAELRQSTVAFEQFLDGSFVSSKLDPGDIDMLCMADAAALDALPQHEQMRLRNLFLGRGTKATHQCDSYFLARVPETDPRHQEFWNVRKYWMGVFGFDRADKPKGFLKVEVVPVPVASQTKQNGNADEPAASSTAAAVGQ
jgi:hypothetical protein